MRIRRLTRNALLTGLALIIFSIEEALPALSPIPGIKLGLSNIITVYAMFAIGPRDTLAILCARILLGAFVTGNVSALMYSAAGGALCYLSMLLLRHVLRLNQVWIASVIGAAFHNFGQVLVAVAITRTVGLFAYLPVLMASGMIAGLFTGLCGQMLASRLKHAP